MGFAKKAFGFLEGLHPHSLLMGRKKSASVNLAGQLAGSYDDLYQPKATPAIPNPVSGTTDSFAARDNMRRLVRRASGRDSTVRTGPGGAPYTAAPKSLLGS